MGGGLSRVEDVCFCVKSNPPITAVCLSFFLSFMSFVGLEREVLVCWCRPECVPAPRTGWSSGRTETVEMEDKSL